MLDNCAVIKIKVFIIYVVKITANITMKLRTSSSTVFIFVGVFIFHSSVGLSLFDTTASVNVSSYWLARLSSLKDGVKKMYPKVLFGWQRYFNNKCIYAQSVESFIGAFISPQLHVHLPYDTLFLFAYFSIFYLLLLKI